MPFATESLEIQPSEHSEIIRRGREAAAALKGNLFNAQLKSAIESGDAASALPLCQTAAQPITDGTTKQFEGVRLRRTSLKLRSPANEPDALDLEVLEAFQSRHDAGMEMPSEMVEQTEQGVRYYEPIFVGKVCLNCRGSRDKMEPAVVKQLALLYPGDYPGSQEFHDHLGMHATGFSCHAQVEEIDPSSRRIAQGDEREGLGDFHRI